jgi:hypothetical protein
MHDHSHDFTESSPRPKAARIDEELPGYAARAAAAGRPDVLSGSDLTGLQRTVGNTAVSSLMEEEASPVHGVVSSGGRPLDEPVRADMEARLGHDFSDVRVHDDAPAHASATAVNAHAYTVGSHVVFQRDAYDPTSTAGRQTLAHELTHVVQQRSGPVEGTAAPGGIKVSDPSDRFEREASETAAQALASPTVGVTDSGPAQRAGEPGIPVQRQEAEEEEELQRVAVQREEQPPEEEAEEGSG